MLRLKSSASFPLVVCSVWICQSSCLGTLLTRGDLVKSSGTNVGSNRTTLSSMKMKSFGRCLISCLDTDLCSGFNIRDDVNGHVLCDFKRGQHAKEALTQMSGVEYYDVPPTKARNCADLYERYDMKTSGVYQINVNPDTSGSPLLVSVYCDMKTDGGKWLVLLRRKDGSVNFDRSWDDYLSRFGDLEGELWMGLDFMYNVTSGMGLSYELRIDMTSFPRLVDNRFQGPIQSGYAKYRHFSVGSPLSYYTLNVSGFSGDWGDSLSYHNGMMFTANGSAHDHDLSPINCAEYFIGPWWYRSCSECRLTAQYGIYLEPWSDGTVTFYPGIFWSTFLGNIEHPQVVEMKIRPV